MNVYNSNGRAINNLTINKKIQSKDETYLIIENELPSGIYFVEATLSNGEKLIDKIVRIE